MDSGYLSCFLVLLLNIQGVSAGIYDTWYLWSSFFFIVVVIAVILACCRQQKRAQIRQGPVQTVHSSTVVVHAAPGHPQPPPYPSPMHPAPGGYSDPVYPPGYNGASAMHMSNPPPDPFAKATYG